ncbi:hypothetical protein SARC_14482 [Sphaeroforma arctica JP610]|uniref:Uncharacterized protein n=1 Tax=Sphaeroforma arctica JP610 TaxID=667725 RepID=A0A0L0F8B2_9EUKA|nr:hypothetical protein SARC_14482 [Sphaeroforma arctica JP610]KNC72957.1 hypothetical protein SARC_14482 [Sphaeroforma arctica JP610]|eukprot:XP_014146859.1 hypothetical protein SARC_14482 [Sphaeroforma arctica JP610]
MTCHHDCGDVVVPELQESNSGDGDTDGDTNSSDDNAETASTYSDSIVWTKCTSTCGTGLRWQICDDCERRLIETCNTHACDDTGAPELEGQDRAGSKDTNRVWKTNTHTDTAAYEDGAEQHIVSTRRTDSASSQVAPLWAYTGLYTIAISIWVNGY